MTGHFLPGWGAAKGAAPSGDQSPLHPKRSAAARELRGGAQRVIPARHFPGRPCLFLSIVIMIMVVVPVPRPMDLSADLACREFHRMDFRVRRVGAQRIRQRIEVIPREVGTHRGGVGSNVGRKYFSEYAGPTDAGELPVPRC